MDTPDRHPLKIREWAGLGSVQRPLGLTLPPRRARGEAAPSRPRPRTQSHCRAGRHRYRARTRGPGALDRPFVPKVDRRAHPIFRRVDGHLWAPHCMVTRIGESRCLRPLCARPGASPGRDDATRRPPAPDDGVRLHRGPVRRRQVPANVNRAHPGVSAGVLPEHWEVLRHEDPKDPALGFLSLLQRSRVAAVSAGYRVSRPASRPRAGPGSVPSGTSG